MHDADDDTERRILGEATTDKIQAILEYVSEIPAIKKDVSELKVDVKQLKSDMVVVKHVLRARERDLTYLKNKVDLITI